MFSKQRLMKFFKSYPILSIKKYNVILTDYVLQRLTLYKPLDDDNTMYAGEFKKTLGNKSKKQKQTNNKIVCLSQ